MDTIFYVIAVFCWLLSGNLYNAKYKNLNFLWLFYFALLLLFQSLNNHYSEDYVLDIIKFATLWFIASGLFQSASSQIIKKVILCLSTFFFVFALVVLLQTFHLFPSKCELFKDSECIDRAGFLNPAISSMFFLIVFFIQLSFAQRFFKTKKFLGLKLFFVANFLLLFVSTFLLGQRTSMLALGLGTAFWAALLVKKYGIIPLLSILGFGFLSTVLAINFSPVLKIKLQMLLTNTDKYGLGCRLAIWKLNWSKFLESPIVGNGESVKYLCAENNLLIHAHNLYLQSLVSCGIFGLVALMGFFMLSLRSVFMRRQTEAFVAGFVALLVAGVFEHWTVHFGLMKAFVVFLNIALAIPIQKKYSKDNLKLVTN